jgi:hypothetical protein
MLTLENSNGNQGKKRVYCIDCFKFIEDGVVRDHPRNGYPVIHHNNGQIHRVIFEADIRFLQELGISVSGQSMGYEMAEMYCVSDDELEQVLANVGDDL